jgi:putative ABC transport system permease protein
MFIPSVKSAIRSLSRQKGFAALNFLGLSVAITISLLVGLMVFHDLSFDHFHKDSARIFRVVTKMDSPNNEVDRFAGVATILPSVIKTEMQGSAGFAEVIHRDEELVRLSPTNFFKEQHLLFADSSFFDLFQFESKQGNARLALSQPNMVLLTESTASKYFPNENAVGRQITLDISDCPVKTFEVAGIMADPPTNSHLPFSILVSLSSWKNDPNAQWGWFMSGQYFYVKTDKNVSATQIGTQITNIANDRKSKDDESRYTYTLQPLSDIHTNLDYADGNAMYTADIEQFYWIGAVTLFLLLIAVINYVNLATALAQRKAREIGVYKTLGASKSQLAFRFVLETFLLVSGAVLCSIVAANMALPMVNAFLEKNIVAHWFSPKMLGFMAILTLTTTFLAGFYPALVLSGFSPVEAFQGKVFKGRKASSLTLRRGLVVFQFMVAQVFIVAVIVAALQMQYIRSKPLGFNKEGVLNLRLPQAEPAKISAFRSEVARISGVLTTSYCIGPPTSRSGFTTRFNRPELYEQNKLEVNFKVADPQYLETYGLQLLHGRFLNDSDMAQTAESVDEKARKYNCVLNETAVKNLGYTPESALGNRVKTGANGIEATIVGVVHDFHTRSLRSPLQSVVMVPFHSFKNTLGIRLESAAANTATLAQVETIWKSVFPADLFTASFLDDYLASLYLAEGRTFTIFRLIALIALLINALGLIGLTVFVVEAKTKEIGIRKVLGASVASVAALITSDFVKLALIASALAIPVANWAMQKWLTDFAYRIEIQWWMFAAASLAAVVIAFLTVGFQSVKAALANPVKSLRSE